MINEKYNRNPDIEEMGMFAFLFLERTNDNYERYIKKIQFNGIDNNDVVKNLFFASKPQFPSFEKFLNHEANK